MTNIYESPGQKTVHTDQGSKALPIEGEKKNCR